MSKMKFANSLFVLGDLGMKHKIPELRDISLSLLNIIPSGIQPSCYKEALDVLPGSQFVGQMLYLALVARILVVG